MTLEAKLFLTATFMWGGGGGGVQTMEFGTGRNSLHKRTE